MLNSKAAMIIITQDPIKRLINLTPPYLFMDLERTDPEIKRIITDEIKRQREGIGLIASENFVSKAVLEAMSSPLTNKYSEGYPGKRYYGGNQHVDKAEALAIERACELFGAEHANVQPYSGSPANMAAYFALLESGDKVMGMSLPHGGHLTHGSKVNFSGRLFEIVPYGVTPEGIIDYDEVRKIALEQKPKLIISGYTAYPRKIDFKRFKEIADEIGAYTLADIAHIAGLIAADLHPSPFPFTDVVTTTTHKTLRGPRGAIILCKKEFAERIDKAVFPFLQGGPHNHTNAAKAVAFKEAMTPEFKSYQSQTIKNAQALAEELMILGFRIVSGGTDNHLILVDLTNKGLTGKEAEEALGEANIYVNKNMIPFDTRSPFNPSGIRLGTPGLTTRGMKEGEMREVASLIAKIIENYNNLTVKNQVHDRVSELCREFPIYDDLL
jgi:glycine hydroxymethyltransferase